jgi:hypothetical protein
LSNRRPAKEAYGSDEVASRSTVTRLIIKGRITSYFPSSKDTKTRFPGRGDVNVIDRGDAQSASINQINGEGNERPGGNELSNVVDQAGG